MKKSNIVGALVMLGALQVLAAFFFVGGINLVLLVATGLLIAVQLVRRGYRGPSAVLLGQVFGLFSHFLTGATLVPILRRLPLTRGAFFRETSLFEPEYARSYVYKELIEVTRLGSILIASLPVAVLIVVGLTQLHDKGKRSSLVNIRNSRSANIRDVLITWLVTSPPVLVAAFKKMTNPYEYVAATMSGDGRNFFLIVENLRVTARPTQFAQVTGQGDFLPSLAAQISSGLGAMGRLDFRDQYSIAAVYVYMSMLMAASLAAYVSEMVVRADNTSDLKLDKNTRLALFGGIGPLLATLGFLIANYGPVMNEVFRSGFFSLYGAYAVTTVFIAVVSMQQTRLTFAACLIALILLCVTYPLALGVLIGPLLVFLTHQKISARLTNWSVFLGSLVVLLFVKAKAWRGILNTIQGRVSLEGAIIPLSTSLLDAVLYIAIGGFFLLRGRSSMANAFRDVALVALSGMVVNRLISSQREQIGLGGTGYYGAKNDYIVFFVSIFVAASLIAYLLSKLIIRMTKILSSVKLPSLAFLGLLWSCTVLSLVSYFFPSQTLLDRADNWIQPRSSSVEFATNSWKQREQMVLSDRDPGEARILNFWLPYFWRQPGWNWVYWEFGSDPTPVCELLRQEPVHISAEKGIMSRINQMCGELLPKD